MTPSPATFSPLSISLSLSLTFTTPTLMMENQISKAMVSISALTWLMAREDVRE
jgi:hypothetical protein